MVNLVLLYIGLFETIVSKNLSVVSREDTLCGWFSTTVSSTHWVSRNIFPVDKGTTVFHRVWWVFMFQTQNLGRNLNVIRQRKTSVPWPSMIFCPSDRPQAHERVEPLCFAFDCHLPSFCSSEILWEFLSLVNRGGWYICFSLIITFLKILKGRHLGTACQMAWCLFFWDVLNAKCSFGRFRD